MRGHVADNVDGALYRLGKSRDVVLTLPNFLAVAAIAAETDLIVTLAERIARRLSAPASLRILKPPFDVDRFDVSMAWNRITEHDLAIQWLRREIRRTSGILARPRGAKSANGPRRLLTQSGDR